MDEEDHYRPLRAVFGPMAEVAAAKAAIEVDPRVGGTLPAAGQPPDALDQEGTLGVFAFVEEADADQDPVDLPAGLTEASPAIAARLVGSAF